MGSGVGRYLWPVPVPQALLHEKATAVLLHLTWSSTASHCCARPWLQHWPERIGHVCPKDGMTELEKARGRFQVVMPQALLALHGASDEPRAAPHSCWSSCSSGTVAERNLNLVPFHQAKSFMYITDGLILLEFQYFYWLLCKRCLANRGG